MRVAYAVVHEHSDGFAGTFGPQPRAEAEQDWDYLVSELRSKGNTLTRMNTMREGNILRRAEFEGPRGQITISLIDDGSW